MQFRPPALSSDTLQDARIAAAIDRHVATTAGTLADVLVTTIVLLDEPRAVDPMRARRYLADLIEALLGVAAGAVVGRVVSTVLRAFGDDVGYELELRLHEALIRIGPGRAPHSPNHPSATTLRAPVRFIQDLADRPLVGELATRLHPRIGRTAHDHHAALTRVAGAVPALRVPALLATLEMLSYDIMLATLWSDHLQLAWQFYSAAVSSMPYDDPMLPAELADGAACQTWRSWLRRIRSVHPAPPAAAVTRPYRALS